MLLIILKTLASYLLFFAVGFVISSRTKRNLLTRPELNEKIKKILKKNEKLILLLINLNNFHNVIEAFGYNIADDIVERTKKKIIDFAIANKAKFFYVGFDEYVIWYQNQSLDNTAIINGCTRLLDIIAEPMLYNNKSIHVTASIGIGLFPEHANTSDLLIRRAEVALRDAKKTGGNSYSFYCSSLTDQAVDLTVMNTELLAALNNGELQLFLQPQIDIKANKLIGAEALVRWHHPVKGSISPEIFINIAEKTGLIVPVGEWVIKHACIQAKFLSQELNISNLKIAINLSNSQFLQGDVVATIANAIHETTIIPSNIAVELTESMFMVNVEKNLLMLSVLMSMGVKLAIDDFGTGYSSFKRLKQLNWDYIKIDKSFITNINYDHTNHAIVAAMIIMAKKLNIKVIAEGVETQAELEALKVLGCDIIQGYYASKPLSITEFIDFAKKFC